jgi:hypothetical protein
MKANEIRLGNYYNDNGEIKKISPNDIVELWEADRTWIKPIPLTEEWLLKFGFITMDAEVDFMEYAKEFEEDSFRFSLYNDGGLNEANDYPFYITTTGQMKGWETEYKTEIKYVHQLQNLYFALTNEELILTNQPN